MDDVMKYGRIASNQSINSRIYRCFEQIDEIDVKRFVKKFKDQPHSGAQVLHTFRELVLGAFLRSNHFRVRSDYKIAGKTPDWSVFDDKLRPKCIIDLINFHIDKRTEDRIRSQIKNKRTATYYISNYERLYDKIWEKASTYKALARSQEVSYVISVFGTFEADVELSEIRKCLFEEEKGLFDLYPEMSGLLYFTEASGNYYFSYIQNLDALRAIDLPQGVF